MNRRLTIPLSPVLAQELHILGLYLRTLRKKQNMTIKDLGERIGADRRTVSKIEKGDPSVSLEIFIAYLHILGLARGISDKILGDYISAISPKKNKKIFSDEKMGYK
jgi:transcriptional regulator with XRE-family HTH domain